MKVSTFFPAAALAIVSTAGAASATTGHNYIMSPGAQDAKGTIEIDLVRSATDGYVEILDYRLGETGQSFGSEDVNAGANSNVRVPVGPGITGDVIAVLYDAAGNMVASEKIDIE